jgi:hypothetical protein
LLALAMQEEDVKPGRAGGGRMGGEYLLGEGALGGSGEVCVVRRKDGYASGQLCWQVVRNR